MKEAEARKKANLLINQDAKECYDACAIVGQIKDNVPRWYLLDLVAGYLMGELT